MKRLGAAWFLALVMPVAGVWRLAQGVPSATEGLAASEVLSARVSRQLLSADSAAPQGLAPQWTQAVDFRGGSETIQLRALDRTPVVDGVDFLEGLGVRSGVVVRAVARRDGSERRSVEFWPDGSMVDRHQRNGQQIAMNRTAVKEAFRACRLVAQDEDRFGDPAFPRRVTVLGELQVVAGSAAQPTLFTIAPIFTAGLAAEIAGVTTGIPQKDLEFWFDSLVHAANYVFERELGITLRRVDITGAYPSNTHQNAFSGGAESLAASGQAVAAAATQSFDFAHLFAKGTGPSGWAAIGSACGSEKGNAATVTEGSESGTLITFLHEVGHQLGAHHSFNTASDARSTFNSGFEPGWGVTLMGYATEFNSFHAGSAKQIETYLRGQACGVRTGGPLPVPALTAPFTERHVPAGTPFVLEVDNDPSLACVRWDGVDPGDQPDSRPPFFAFDPKCAAARSFPSAPHDIVRNHLPGLLPTAPVSLAFRATGWSSAFGRTTTDVRVAVESEGPFEVSDLSCIAGCEAHSRAIVTWDSTIIAKTPFDAATMRAELVYQNGETFELHPGVSVSEQQLEFAIPPPGTTPVAPCTAKPHPARVVLRPAPGGYFAVSEWIGVTVPNECVSP